MTDRPPSFRAERVVQRVLAFPMRLAGFHSRYRSTSYGRFHYYDSMPGSSEPPVVLLHGLGALGLSLFGLAELLRRRRRVVLPDLFHFLGLSEPLRSRFDTDEHIDAILELLQSLHVGAIDLCGHSAGGGAAVLVALRMPDRVRSLALLNPAGFSHGFEALREEILSVDDAERARQIYERVVSARGVLGASPIRRLGGRAIARFFGRPGVRDYLESIRPSDFVDSALHDLRCPTLLLWGDDDRILPQDIAIHIAAEAPDVHACWVMGGSPLLPIDHPYTVYELLLQFWGVERTTRPAFRRLVALVLRPRPAEPIVVAPGSIRPPRDPSTPTGSGTT